MTTKVWFGINTASAQIFGPWRERSPLQWVDNKSAATSYEAAERILQYLRCGYKYNAPVSADWTAERLAEWLELNAE